MNVTNLAFTNPFKNHISYWNHTLVNKNAFRKFSISKFYFVLLLLDHF